MATDYQERRGQKRNLQEVLLIKREADKKGIMLYQLEEYLNRLEAEMEQEDVAYVQKMVAALEHDGK